eukprot:COSAG05_NODE_8798_length_670_cov_1.478109_1_plen_54_part_01
MRIYSQNRKITLCLSESSYKYCMRIQPRLAHTRAMAAFAPALIPMLTPHPARVF